MDLNTPERLVMTVLDEYFDLNTLTVVLTVSTKIVFWEYSDSSTLHTHRTHEYCDLTISSSVVFVLNVSSRSIFTCILLILTLVIPGSTQRESILLVPTVRTSLSTATIEVDMGLGIVATVGTVLWVFGECWDQTIRRVVCPETLLCCLLVCACALFVLRSYRTVQIWVF